MIPLVEKSNPNSIVKSNTLVDLLQVRAAQQPNKKAYIFLKDGQTESDSLTYQQLATKAKAIAAHLQSIAQEGDRILLLYPQGLEVIAAFYGCLCAKMVAIPVPSPELGKVKRALPRLRSIIRNAEAKIILSTPQIAGLVQKLEDEFLELRWIKWINSEEIKYELANHYIEPQTKPQDIAYLQYTSGSTSEPKGVIMSHGNLIHHSADLQKAWGYTSDSVAITWMPYFHDYGLVDGIIQPLYSGIPSYIMTPLAFLRNPIRWLQAISHYGGTHSQGPNFAYDYCLQKISSQQCVNLDLSSWKTASNGAEPIRQSTIEAFINTFSPYGFRPEAFYPSYGLAEATLLVSTKNHAVLPKKIVVDKHELAKNRIVEVGEGKSGNAIVSCGHPIGNMKVIIVNPETRLSCLDQRVGEIWISDPSVALGYWCNANSTRQSFQAYTVDTQEGPFLRTGDLGFFKDGELYITGRLKDVIIIRGRNYYPQDIELIVEKCHCALRPHAGAAFSVEVEGNEQLVIVQEVEKGFQKKYEAQEVFEIITRTISEQFELQVYAIALLKSGSLLKTSSGKIQRQRCKKAYLEQVFEPVALWEAEFSQPLHFHAQSLSLKALQTRTEDAVQNWLSYWLAQRLGISLSSVNPHKAFADYGMDSVVAVELAQAIEDELGQEINLDATITWNFSTIHALSQYIAHSPKVAFFNTYLPTSPKRTDELDTLSEEELAELLWQELALTQQLRI